MPLQTGLLRGLKPVTPPPSGLDRTAKVLNVAGGVQQVQAGQMELEAKQQAVGRAKQIEQVLIKHSGDIEKALPELGKIDPALTIGLTKSMQDIKKSQADIATAQKDDRRLDDTLAETRRKNSFDEAQKMWERTKPQEVSAGATLVPHDQSLPYTAPKASTSNLQSKEIVDPAGGKNPVFANFNPDTGDYIDPVTKQVIPNAKPYERPQDPAIAQLREVQTKLAEMQVAGMGLTPNQRANEVNSLRNSFQKAIAPIMERRGAIAKIDSGLKALDQGNFRDSTQILITAFNKLLDEISVVREGEYARTSEGQAAYDRITGSIDQLRRGGTSLTKENLQQLGNTAKDLAKSVGDAHEAELGNVRESIEKSLDDYKIPHDRVFGSSQIGKRKAPAGTGAKPPAFTLPDGSTVTVQPDGSYR